MAIGKDRAVLRQLRTLFDVGTIRDLTDGQLLERFAGSRGEAAELAFAVLVERHGPMVLRVCRSILVNPHDTEDAFQATFLVLVKKARALWVRDSLGPWLHQVAHRTASCARSMAACRRRHERSAKMLAKASRSEVTDELERLLHEEIDRLPERYRTPVVLCDLEGCTHEQAARHLGWPVGTVKSRQARGRERLRARLHRRGVAPDAGVLATALVPDGSIALVPPSLVDSTARAVAQFVTVGTSLPVSVTSLAQGVLRSMSMTRWLKVVSTLLVLGATASGAGLLAQKEKAGDEHRSPAVLQAARADDMPVHEVKPDKLKVAVSKPGVVVASRNEDAYCRVEGSTVIIKIVPEGTHVKKGDLVCELDSASLRDELTSQMIAKHRAEADYQNAKIAHEAAGVAASQHIAALYQHELDRLNVEIAAAQSAIRDAEHRLARVRSARSRMNRTPATNQAARTPADIVAELDTDDRIEATERDLKRQQTALDLAKVKRDVIAKSSPDKTTKGSDIDVARKHLDELAKQAGVELETRKIKKLENQIAACRLVAPIDGPVVHANDPNRRFGPTAIEEGATVRERQKIFSIPDLGGSMQVLVKVPESMVGQVARGLRGRIKVDAFPEETLAGLVSEVAALPDTQQLFERTQKVYSTRVKIGKGPTGLRPGMTAQVEILIADLDNVLSVPTQAVLRRDDKFQVAVKSADGRFVWRDVIVGAENETSFEIKKGIEPGDRVALSPLALLTDPERKAIDDQSKSKR